MRRAEQVIQKVGEIGEEAATRVLIEHDTRGVARRSASKIAKRDKGI